MSWTLVLLLSAGSYLFKAVGLLALSGRDVPAPVLRFVGLLPPALLAALIVVQTIGADGGALRLDARIVGLLVAGVAVWRRAPFLVVVVSGMVTAALLRAVA